jgi:hypothetical protein
MNSGSIPPAFYNIGSGGDLHDAYIANYSDALCYTTTSVNAPDPRMSA